MSYRVVEEFERELARYTGAPYVVTTNSCSSAILIACAYFREHTTVTIPACTYCAAPQSVIHAGHEIRFANIRWSGEYSLSPLPVWDSARRFTSDMYRPSQMQCVSFQTSKILGLEQGGAILHDNEKADEWLRRARFDGRLNASEKLPKQVGWHVYMNPSIAALGLQHLACLPLHNDDQAGSEDFPDLSLLDIWP